MVRAVVSWMVPLRNSVPAFTVRLSTATSSSGWRRMATSSNFSGITGLLMQGPAVRQPQRGDNGNNGYSACGRAGWTESRLFPFLPKIGKNGKFGEGRRFLKCVNLVYFV